VVLPTPLDELRRPHPDQARIDREAAAVLLRSSRVGPARVDRTGAANEKSIEANAPSYPDLQLARR
jgi:hypothetical protein